MSKTKKIAVLAIIAMVLMMLPAQIFAATDSDTDRIAGADRIATAIAIADAGWSSAENVILAPSPNANLVDALAAAPLAGQLNAPILLTETGALNATVKAKISALGAKNVYLVGALSDAVKNEVAGISGVTAEVLKGASRWETADAINAKLTSPAGSFVVGYNAIPDALSVASYAAKNDFAIVLTKADGTVDSSKLVGSTTYLVGGTGVVKDYAGATRFGGSDRFATNTAVASGLEFSYGKVYVANGLSCVDALAVAPLAAQDSAFVALSSASDVAAASVVNDKINASSQVIAVGGTGAVPDSVRDKVGLGAISEPVSAEIKVKDYDDDTKDQYVEFTVNGKATTVEALNNLGWDLEFTAGSSKYDDSDSTTVFADQTTGLLSSKFAPADVKDYYVQVTLTKDSDIIVSNSAKITIKNLNITATGISDYTLNNDNGTGTSPDDDFEMDSSKLVVGEIASFDKVTVTNGSAKEDIDTSAVTGIPSKIKLDTSDVGVVSVGGTGHENEITAQGPGTATITIKYGNATKKVSFTVDNDAREAKTVKVKKDDGTVVSSIKVLKSKTTDLYVNAVDQYGDTIKDPTLIPVFTNNTPTVLDPVNTKYDTVTENLLHVQPLATGNASLTFNAAGTGGKKLGTFNVTVTNDTSVTKAVFEMYKVDTDEKLALVTGSDGIGISTLTKDDFSTDTTLDASDDAYVVYQVKDVNADGISLGNEAITSGDITVTESKSGVVGTPVIGVDNRIYIHGEKAGTATIKVTGTYSVYTVKVTVVDEGYAIKSITLKTPGTSDYSKTYNYKSVLYYTSTGNDPVLDSKYVTLQKATTGAIRIVITTSSVGTKGAIYIDKDADGVFSTGDTIVGFLVTTVTGTVGGYTDANPTDPTDDIVTVPGDDGNIIYKVYSAKAGVQDKIIAQKSVKVDL